MANARADTSTRIAQLEEELQSLNCQYEDAKRVKEAQADTLKRCLEEQSRLQADVEEQLAKAMLAEAALKASDLKLLAAEALRGELDTARNEVAKLKATAKVAQDAGALRQEVLSLIERCDREQVRAETAERRLSQMFDKVEAAGELEATVTRLKEALSTAQDVTGEKDVKRVLQQYQQHEVETAAELAKLRVALNGSQRDAAGLNEALAACQAELEVTLAKARAEAQRALDWQGSAEVAQDQSRHWAALEEARASAARRQAGDTSASDTALKLHAAVQNAQAQVATVRAEKEAAVEQAQAAIAAKAEAERQLKDAQQAIKRLGQHDEHLTAQVTQMQTRLGAGEFNRSTTKVVHLKLNPATAARRDFLEHELETVKAENEALRDHVQELERARTNTASAGAVAAPGGTDDASSAPTAVKRTTRLQAELRVAQQTVQDLKRRLEKLQVYFTESSKQYRKAVRDVLGWNMVLKRKIGDAASTFTLQLAGRAGAEDTITIVQSGDGAMDLDVTAPCLQHPALVKMVQVYYVQNRDMPGLLANVVLTNQA